MAINIIENLTESDRAIELDALGPVVFVTVSCGVADHPQHVIGVDRADFYAAIKSELGLVHPFEVEARSVDWDRELTKLTS